MVGPSQLFEQLRSTPGPHLLVRQATGTSLRNVESTLGIYLGRKRRNAAVHVSKKSRFGKREAPTVADDEVIEHPDVHQG